MQAKTVEVVLQQLRDGMHYMHSKAKVLHLDVEPKNLLWHEPSHHLYIIDFSLSERWPCGPQQVLADTYVTLPYRAPELFVAGPPPRQVLRPSVDAWSIGCILWEMLANCKLFNPPCGHEDARAYGVKVREFARGTLAGDVWLGTIPAGFRRALKSLLHPRPERREVLGSPFVFTSD